MGREWPGDDVDQSAQDEVPGASGPPHRTSDRPLGFVDGTITDKFLEPLPDDELDAWA